MREYISKIAGWSALALVLGFFYYKSISVDAKEQVWISTELRQLRHLDEALGKYVLQARVGTLNNYDAIVATQRKINTEMNRLTTIHPELFTGGSELAVRFAEYQVARAEKDLLLNEFKSQNSVLRNSVRYFPLAVRQLLNGEGHIKDGDPLEVEIRDRLLGNMLEYQLVPSDEARSAILGSITAIALKKESHVASERAQLESLTMHSAILLAYKNQTDETINKIINSPTVALGDAVYEAYSRHFEKIDREANLYRFWMMLFGLGGLIYGAYSYISIHRARNELQESLDEIRFQKFALDQHSIVSIADRGGRIIYTNKKFSEISQYSEEELIGHDHRLLNSGYHPSSFFKEMWLTIGHGKVWRGEVCNRAKDGHLYWVESTIVPFMDAHGKPLKYVSIRTDISERKRLDASIKHQRDFYERISETMGEGLYVQDKDGICTYMNSEAEKLLGWNREEFVGKPVHATTHPKTADGKPLAEADCPINRITRSGERLVSDSEVFVRRDGSVFPVGLVSQGIFSGGEYQGAVVAFHDITLQKQVASAMLAAKEAAEEASLAKSNFLANMSHEIRTPMNGIIGMTELALDTELTVEQKEYMSLVKVSADSLLTIVNDILDFSKIEAGHLEIDNIDFNLQDVLSQTARSMALRAHQKGLELLLDIAPDIPEMVIGDPGRLRQVIVNLLGNAVKFTSKGEVVLKAELLDTHDNPDKFNLHISVRDTGIGIPRDKFQAIFESFAQADASTTRKYGGTGLGLTISTRLVELMNGAIWVESELGQGSTFHVAVEMGRSQQQGKAAMEAVDFTGMRVLVVDDNATNRDLILELMRRWKMQPHAVDNGRDALAELQRALSEGEAYQVVLLDQQMPGLSGFDVVDRMREQPGLENTAILMLTSDGQRGDAARCRELGIAAYLLKPFSQSDLFDAMMDTLGLARVENAPLVTRHTIRVNKRNLNILLAEDNAVNQTLAVRLLNKFGHTVTVANNGREAVALWQENQYDLILMDVDMPELNGFGATAQIRAQESVSGKRTPIIGLTAHALQGSREECLAAGMDGYVSKPIDTEALWAELESIKGGNPALESQPMRAAQKPVALAFDRDRAMALMDNDMELYRDMVTLFLSDYGGYRDKLGVAISQNNVHDIRHFAHTLKGMLSVFGVEAIAGLAERIELQKSISFQDDFDEFDAALGWLETQLRQSLEA